MNRPSAAFLYACAITFALSAAPQDWPTYGGDPGETH